MKQVSYSIQWKANISLEEQQSVYQLIQYCVLLVLLNGHFNKLQGSQGLHLQQGHALPLKELYMNIDTYTHLSSRDAVSACCSWSGTNLEFSSDTADIRIAIAQLEVLVGIDKRILKVYHMLLI